MTETERSIRKAIGYEMRTQRVIRRKTLQDIADHMGKVRSTISAYELGKIAISVEDLKTYCDYLGVDYIDLLQKVADEK